MDSLKPKYSLTGTILTTLLGLGWIGAQQWINAGLLLTLLGAFVCFLFAVMLFLDYYQGRRSEDRRAEMYADGLSPVNVINALARLDPDMQHNLTAARAVVETIPNFDGPSRTIKFWGDGTPYPYNVFEAVWDLANERGMPAVRTWGDETQARRCATAMVNWFVSCGWLKPAVGNQPAQWTNNGFELARIALFGREK